MKVKAEENAIKYLTSAGWNESDIIKVIPHLRRCAFQAILPHILMIAAPTLGILFGFLIALYL